MKLINNWITKINEWHNNRMKAKRYVVTKIGNTWYAKEDVEHYFVKRKFNNRLCAIRNAEKRNNKKHWTF